MKLRDLVEILGADVLVGTDLLQRDVEMACGSDLMSDVLAFVKPGSLLLTGLTNPQVVRTAEMADLAAICFVRGKIPEEQTVQMAQARGIPMLTTPLSMFEACGRLHNAGLASCFDVRRDGSQDVLS